MSESSHESVPALSSRPYLYALVGSMLIGVLLRIQIIRHYINQSYKQDIFLNFIRDFLLTFYALLLIFFLYLLFFKWLPRLRSRLPISRGLMRLMGIVTSLQFVANMTSVNVSIYRLHIESYKLLVESLALYVAINLAFVFWYWFFDYPLRVTLHQISSNAYLPQGILFPEEQMEERFLNSDNWLPGPIDYLYFTILSSNCFGSPEGHLLVGNRLKTLQIVHTLFMILVFIIIVARAINTLT